MKFYIKPKHFAQYRSFKIRDESQGELFKIKGKFFLGMRSLKMKDMSNQLLYSVVRRFNFKLYRAYDVLSSEDKVVAKVHRTFGWFKPRYTIIMNDKKFHFEGSVLQHVFAIHDEDNELARIEKRVFSFGDAYEIDVKVDKDPLLHLFLIIIIDQMNHERKKFHS